MEALDPRIAEQEAELLRPQEPPPVSSARVDAHLATKEAEAGDAMNAAETAGDGTVGVVMEEARRHLADLEPKGAVEALLAVTAVAESRGDDGNVATLLTSACHRLMELVALRCLSRVNPKYRDAFLDMAEKAFGTQRYDKATGVRMLHACSKMKEIAPSCSSPRTTRGKEGRGERRGRLLTNQ